jgi:hypothetical protein
LKELVGNVPQRLEEKQLYRAKLEAAQTSLKMATKICDEKRVELKTLREAMRTQQASLLIQNLVGKAQEFNAAIDKLLTFWQK